MTWIIELNNINQLAEFSANIVTVIGLFIGIILGGNYYIKKTKIQVSGPTSIYKDSTIIYPSGYNNQLLSFTEEFNDFLQKVKIY